MVLGKPPRPKSALSTVETWRSARRPWLWSTTWMLPTLSVPPRPKASAEFIGPWFTKHMRHFFTKQPAPFFQCSECNHVLRPTWTHLRTTLRILSFEPPCRQSPSYGAAAEHWRQALLSPRRVVEGWVWAMVQTNSLCWALAGQCMENCSLYGSGAGPNSSNHSPFPDTCQVWSWKVKHYIVLNAQWKMKVTKQKWAAWKAAKFNVIRRHFVQKPRGPRSKSNRASPKSCK